MRHEIKNFNLLAADSANHTVCVATRNWVTSFDPRHVELRPDASTLIAVFRVRPDELPNDSPGELYGVHALASLWCTDHIPTSGYVIEGPGGRYIVDNRSSAVRIALGEAVSFESAVPHLPVVMHRVVEVIGLTGPDFTLNASNPLYHLNMILAATGRTYTPIIDELMKQLRDSELVPVA